jgi:hypothetical protein
VKLLLRRGADVEARDDTNQTPEKVASKNGKFEVTSFLAEYKSDADVRNRTHSSTLDLDQYGVDEDEKDEKGSLLDAAKEGNIDLVELLVTARTRSRCQWPQCNKPDSIRQSNFQGECRSRPLAHRARRRGGFTVPVITIWRSDGFFSITAQT